MVRWSSPEDRARRRDYRDFAPPEAPDKASGRAVRSIGYAGIRPRRRRQDRSKAKSPVDEMAVNAVILTAANTDTAARAALSYS